MSWRDAALAGWWGLLAALSGGAAGWAWRLDRRSGEPGDGWRGRLGAALVPFAHRAQLAISLVLADVFLLFLVLPFDGVADAVAGGAALALVPLIVLSVTTFYLGWPELFVPPWARRGAPPGPEPDPEYLELLDQLEKSNMANNGQGWLTLTAGLGFAIAALGLIWLIAVPELVRLWGAFAILVGIAMMVSVGVRQR